MVSGLAFAVTYLFDKYNILLLNSIPEWAYAILLMYIVWWLMMKYKLDWIVDVGTKTKISSALMEYAIVASIISLPLQAVFTFVVPIVVMVTGGLILTVTLAYFLSRKFFADHWFERGVTILGTNTGVFLTGLLLLTMVDPDMKSPVLRDYSLSYSINSVISFILFPSLKKSVPILEGTTEEELLRGAGHFDKTGMPGDNKQVLISGHRDTVFTQMGELEHGDKIIIELPYGDFEYEIEKTEITDADDTSIVDLGLREEELVVTTCYPFNYVGSAPERYIIYAYPVDDN